MHVWLRLVLIYDYFVSSRHCTITSHMLYLLNINDRINPSHYGHCSPIWESHLGEPFGRAICCPKLHSSLTFSHLADNRDPHIFHTSIVMTEASSWNWFGVNNGGIHANGFSCDRIMCYIIDQRDRHFKN